MKQFWGAGEERRVFDRELLYCLQLRYIFRFESSACFHESSPNQKAHGMNPASPIHHYIVQ
jgi:hypothetical protein